MWTKYACTTTRHEQGRGSDATAHHLPWPTFIILFCWCGWSGAGTPVTFKGPLILPAVPSHPEKFPSPFLLSQAISILTEANYNQSIHHKIVQVHDELRWVCMYPQGSVACVSFCPFHSCLVVCLAILHINLRYAPYKRITWKAIKKGGFGNLQSLIRKILQNISLKI